MAQKNDDMNATVAAYTYEEARSKLVDIVSALEQGSLPLEDALAHWELGEALAKHCQELLDGARARLDEASKDSVHGTSTAGGEQ